MSTIANKEMLLYQLSCHKQEIKAFGVKRLGIFGSFVRDIDIHQNSDVDFLVEFESNKKNYDNFMDLSCFMESLLGRNVELITPQSLSKYIGPHILKEVENVNL